MSGVSAEGSASRLRYGTRPGYPSRMARKARISAALVSLMQGGEHHAWTLEELHAGLAKRGSATDFSSVFRAAEKLAAEGMARKLLLDDGRARFELVGGHHDHLYCTRCHELVPVPCVIEGDGFAALERATGAAIHDHQIILSGFCRDCRAALDKTEAPA
jgi:Fur family transcriptional regulator, ferric uptake regulator